MSNEGIKNNFTITFPVDRVIKKCGADYQIS
jgi:hypothetical protein